MGRVVTIPELLAQCESLEAKATAGPWRPGVPGNYRVYGPDGQGPGVSGLLAVTMGGSQKAADNRDFIAFARTALPQLVALVERMEAAGNGMRNGTTPCCEDANWDEWHGLQAAWDAALKLPVQD